MIIVELRDQVTFLCYSAEAAVQRQGSMTNEDMLAVLRMSVQKAFTSAPDYVAKTAGTLHDAGVVYGWQYAQLSTSRLTEIVGVVQSMTAVRLFMAKEHGLMPDTHFSEADLREVHERPRNLYAVDGMAERLGLRLASSEGRALFAKHHVPDDVRDRIAGELYETVMSSTILDMVTNWPIVERVLTGEGRNYFVTARRIADIEAHGTVDKRLERLLAELGLWAPLVWTDEERDARPDPFQAHLDKVAADASQD